jgi:hypothetical protein
MNGNWQKMTEGQEKYHAYLCSPEWNVKRVAVMQRAGEWCERCKKSKPRHVHHATYIRKYAEELTDLLGVCPGCHEFIHDPTKEDPVEYWKKIAEDEKPFATISRDGYVQCPACKGDQDYVHMIAATVIQNTRADLISGDGHATRRVPNDGMRRGSQIVIGMLCECGCEFNWRLDFRKGCTMFAVNQIALLSPATFAKELWRD